MGQSETEANAKQTKSKREATRTYFERRIEVEEIVKDGSEERSVGGSEEQVQKLTFWRNWYEVAEQYPDDMRLAWYDAIMRYAFSGKSALPTGDALGAVGFTAVKIVEPIINKSQSLASRGRKGGSQAKAKQKPSESQTEANKNKNKNKNKNAVAYPQTPKGGLARREYYRASLELFKAEHERLMTGVPDDYLEGIYPDLVKNGWRDLDSGEPIYSAVGYVKEKYRRDLKAKMEDPTNDPFYVPPPGSEPFRDEPPMT